MGPGSRRNHASSVQPLGPLMEGPYPEANGERGKKERYWEVIRTWLRLQMDKGMSGSHSFHGGSISKTTTTTDLRLILGVLGCPLAPIPLTSDQPTQHLSIKDSPIETSSAHYIIQQYLAATGCLKQDNSRKSMYAAGSVKVVCHETDGTLGKIGGRAGGEHGCFVVWQKSPGMWSVELVVADDKVVAGSNGKVVWRNLPWLGTNAARGPQRPLRRIVQGLDPKTTASMFTKARCLGEKHVRDENCFVLKVSVDRATVAERSDGSAEVIRHVLYGYFSQKSGLLIYIEDSHLTRVQAPGTDAIYWETTIGSVIEDYKEVDGVLIAHQGRSVATVLRFGDSSANNSRIRMEEAWRIEDVVFNVPGLSDECFIPPKEIVA
ncbi:hypothetical protein Cni_G13677 [Canna indica]|uniref:C-type mannose receptor 2 n=1 Tax=Canna indica TaxID=4628 RepID=A0AAQ3KBL3_9LILI|nr:hypothetical protein Cni_G13677 [Canna indica]